MRYCLHSTWWYDALRIASLKELQTAMFDSNIGLLKTERLFRLFRIEILENEAQLTHVALPGQCDSGGSSI